MALPPSEVFSPLESLSIERFGGKTFPREVVTSVTASRVVLLPNNPNRFFWRLINEGVSDVRVSIDPTLSSTSGWLLQANGGTIEMFWEDDGEAVGYQLFAISVGGAVNIRSLEVLRL